MSKINLLSIEEVEKLIDLSKPRHWNYDSKHLESEYHIDLNASLFEKEPGLKGKIIIHASRSGEEHVNYHASVYYEPKVNEPRVCLANLSPSEEMRVFQKIAGLYRSKEEKNIRKCLGLVRKLTS